MPGKYVNKWTVILILCLCLGLAVFAGVRLRSKQAAAFSVGQTQYDASKDIKEAMDRLQAEKQEAKVAGGVNTIEKVAAVNILGISDEKTNERVLELISQYGQRATFMLSGMAAAEYPDFIKGIKEKGHRVGSNGLKGEKHLEELSEKELVQNFAKTNVIMKTVGGEAPKVLQASSTRLTKELLEAAFACGYEYVADSRSFLNYQSFSSYDQALDYVKGLKRGSVITVKMSGILDETEYEKEVEEISTQADEDRPMETSQAETRTEEERLIQVVDWLSKALDEAGYQTVFVEDLQTYEDEDFTADFAELREKNAGKLARVYSSALALGEEVGITFRGIGNQENLSRILSFLKENQVKATFFVTGEELLEYEDSIKEIIAQGHEIGNGGLTGNDLTALSFPEVCLEIDKTDKLLKDRYGVNTSLFMPVYAKYNDLVLEAASSLSYEVVTYSKNPIVDDKPAEEIIKYFSKGIGKGEFIHLRLDLNDEVVEVAQAVLDMVHKKNYRVSFLKKLVEETAYALSLPVQAVGGSIDFHQVRAQNKGKLAEVINTVYTTSQELSFTFYGIHQKEALYDVLEKLDQIQGKATFFVTDGEIDKNGEEIRQILARGHEIGISLNAQGKKDFNSVYSSVTGMQNKLKRQFGAQAVLVRYPYMIEITGEMLEAFSSAGCTLIWQDLSLANSKVSPEGTLEEIIAASFNAGNISARRGYILYFRLDYYKAADTIGKVILDIYEKRILTNSYADERENNGTQYRIVSVSALRNSPGVYSYPVKESDYIYKKDIIAAGHLEGFTQQQKAALMQARYIGSPDISTYRELPGFTPKELEKLDKTGRVTNDKVLFLTFDDWGSDQPINQILYVLRKYGVQASFFVRTNYVETNPNLLRSIALEGHDIGSHTDKHNPYSNLVPSKGSPAIYESLTEEEILDRKEDLALSFGKLQTIIGDVETGGKPALTKIFRPPTLAMSRNGMEAVYDMGFDYIVSGDISTHDYEKSSPEELADELLNGIVKKSGEKYLLRNGSVLVLHMSNDTEGPSSQPDLTARALDMAIPVLLERGYRFDKLSNYLALPEEAASEAAQ
ncbi:MAG: polysaccharide deacetylase family protein [Lacrimispora sp.]|uniref:polysaccharide deacetylase family protein n=1 Tax=Lacrimispora sp. TaxID=2719234 RepID=UPI0039E6BCD1